MDTGPATELFDPPVEVVEPATLDAPVVFASPHSGSQYPPGFVAAARLDPLMLRRSEDAFVDALFGAAPALGMPLLRARFPRAYLDPNREPWELDPGMFDGELPEFVNRASPRATAGLGTIARVVASGAEIYRDKLPFAEAKRRVDLLYLPYHARLEALMARAQEGWKQALLIDCHSMPSIGGPMDRDAGRRRVDFVLGDCHGAACAPGVARLVETTLKDLGYAIARNDPYAGGHTTRHYGRPAKGRHALQVEINRALYMDELRIERKPYFATLERDLARLIAALGDHARAGFA